MSSSVRTYRWAQEAPRSALYKVEVEGQDATALASHSEHFASYEVGGPHRVVIELPEGVRATTLSPLRHLIPWSQEGRHVTIQVPGPGSYCLQCEGAPSLFLYAHPPQVQVRRDKATVIPEGSYADLGEQWVGSGEALIIEGGAFVRGCVRSLQSEDVMVGGRGVLDGGDGSGLPFRRTVLMEGCRNVQVEDLAVINPSGWMVVFGACEDVHVRGLREIGTRLSSDGIDVVGCRRVRVQDCCLRNGDDCLVIKALDLSDQGKARISHACQVEDVVFEDCMLMNHLGGSAMEIGYELRGGEVRDVTFRRIDVLSVHHHGSVFGIHNSDSALVKNILWDQIWVEHHYDKLIDLRIVKSRWGRSQEAGRVQGVRIQNVDVRMLDYNWGYTTSLIGGWDEDHLVEDVSIHNLRFNGQPVRSEDDLFLYCKRAKNVRITSD